MKHVKEYILGCFTQHCHLQVENSTEYNKTQEQYNKYTTLMMNAASSSEGLYQIKLCHVP
jgi:hypothetical protein